MKKVVSSLLAVIFILGVANVHAQRKTSRGMPCKSGMSYDYGKGPGYGKDANELPAAYSAPARIDCTGGWDFFASGTFIYWYASQQHMYITSFTDGNTPSNQGLNTQKFKYKPGFKCALGTNFGHDDWTGKVEYTRLHGTTTMSTAPPQNPPGTMLIQRPWASATFINQALNTVNSRWKNSLDLIDGELGRWYYSGLKLTFKPYSGVRWGWIDQKLRIRLTTIAAANVPVTLRSRSDSWLLGPRAGVDGNWLLGYGFRLTGNVAGSLLYQRIKARSTQRDAANDVQSTVSVTDRLLVPNADIGIGIGWGSYFTENRWHFDLSAAYEFHYFWNQNLMYAVGNATTGGLFTATKPGDLSYHGLTLTAKFDF